MEPSPVGVDDDLTVDVSAARRGTCLVGEAWVSLRGVATDLLGRDRRDQGESRKGQHGVVCCLTDVDTET